ncbi:MAG: HD domain-containing protein [Candidatus Aminicenantes bacterium]|jgi:HD-GYP domain-containing protein (c-di-GMP phosphodiesterase class II)|nr:HD domain-containing protein [Candidatus Aminicenantes bacterium]
MESTTKKSLSLSDRLRQSEDRLNETARIRRIFSQCNKALIGAADEAALLKDICRILVESGGYSLTRIGIPSDSVGTTYRTVAQSGADDARQGPDASEAALPLKTQETSLGVLEIHTPDHRAISGEENEVLTELAEIISFGIMGLRARNAVLRTEEELKQTLKNLRGALGGVIELSESVVEIRDPCTAGHQRRVSDLARSIATNMGMPKEQIEGIRIAGSIHDIGKISIPADILCKPGLLTSFEFDLVKAHPKIGYDLLKTIQFPWKIADIVYQHHEHMDGSGYPLGLSGKDILIEARIIRIADVVEAMSSHRPYRPAFPFEKVMDEITRKQGACFDTAGVASCVDLFISKNYMFH